nr:hypothetical protein [Alteromonas macleodii]|tara:strand:+ start:22953 stop:24014 length:1062 start_codon:yes stop_codon:yes gene_type:complete
MNNIEQMIAAAQNNAAQAATAQQETQVTQQAVGQDYQQANTVQADTTQQQATQQQANPQVVNQTETYTQQANPQAVNTQQANAQQATQQANPQVNAQASAIPAHIQQQAQQANTAPQQAQQPQQTPMAVNPVGNTGMDLPANLPPELAKFIGQREMSMDTMSNSDLLVQDWLKPSYHGMVLGSAPSTLLNPFQVEIDMTENVGYMLCQMVRWTVAGATGDQTNYVHTYDGLIGSDGQPWANAVMTAYGTTTDPKKPNVPFPSVQLPMRLINDIANQQGEVIAQAGIMIGHTTAKTGWQNWQNFHNACKQAGLLGQKVIVEVSNQPVAPKGITYKWGTLEFKLIGQAQGQIAAQ